MSNLRNEAGMGLLGMLMISAGLSLVGGLMLAYNNQQSKAAASDMMRKEGRLVKGGVLDDTAALLGAQTVRGFKSHIPRLVDASGNTTYDCATTNTCATFWTLYPPSTTPTTFAFTPGFAPHPNSQQPLPPGTPLAVMTPNDICNAGTMGGTALQSLFTSGNIPAGCYRVPATVTFVHTVPADHLQVSAAITGPIYPNFVGAPPSATTARITIPDLSDLPPATCTVNRPPASSIFYFHWTKTIAPNNFVLYAFVPNGFPSTGSATADVVANKAEIWFKPAFAMPAVGMGPFDFVGGYLNGTPVTGARTPVGLNVAQANTPAGVPFTAQAPSDSGMNNNPTGIYDPAAGRNDLNSLHFYPIHGHVDGPGGPVDCTGNATFGGYNGYSIPIVRTDPPTCTMSTVAVNWGDCGTMTFVAQSVRLPGGNYPDYPPFDLLPTDFATSGSVWTRASNPLYTVAPASPSTLNPFGLTYQPASRATVTENMTVCAPESLSNTSATGYIDGNASGVAGTSAQCTGTITVAPINTPTCSVSFNIGRDSTNSQVGGTISVSAASPSTNIYGGAANSSLYPLTAVHVHGSDGSDWNLTPTAGATTYTWTSAWMHTANNTSFSCTATGPSGSGSGSTSVSYPTPACTNAPDNATVTFNNGTAPTGDPNQGLFINNFVVTASDQYAESVSLDGADSTVSTNFATTYPTGTYKVKQGGCFNVASSSDDDWNSNFYDIYGNLQSSSGTSYSNGVTNNSLNKTYTGRVNGPGGQGTCTSSPQLAFQCPSYMWGDDPSWMLDSGGNYTSDACKWVSDAVILMPFNSYCPYPLWEGQNGNVWDGTSCPGVVRSYNYNPGIDTWNNCAEFEYAINNPSVGDCHWRHCNGTGCIDRGCDAGCFDTGTKILMGDGQTEKFAGDIMAGESLWNPVEKRPMKIEKIVLGPEPIPMVEVGYDDHVMKVTHDHPMATRRGLVPAEAVKLTDRLLGSDGDYHPIRVARRLPVDPDQVVINFIFVHPRDDLRDHMVSAEGMATGDWFLQQRLKEHQPIEGKLP